MSDEVWKYLIASFFGCLMSFIGLVANRNAARAAAEAVKVREDLKVSDKATSTKLDEISKVGEKTHTLVNANMGAQLKISAVALRTIATLQRTPHTVAAAELAEKLLQEHEAKQASVDAKEKHE